jgi:phosphoribosylaminoimidazolecarboxamide formyltransferase / IMP cyclohydrolase
MDKIKLELSKIYDLKYGCNPHQKEAKVYTIDNSLIPFSIINGTPGYINILDAINSWNLVSEIKYSINKIAAASFKHVSPAGVAIGKSSLEAYQNARECDPKSSFGDFIAVNSIVDEDLAKYIKNKVCDGIIAPSFDKEAITILKQKKNYKFIILKASDIDYNNQSQTFTEFKLFKNMAISQENNSHIFGHYNLQPHNIVSNNKNVSQNIIEDLIISNITLKYTQSNSVCIAYQGRTIGIGAGQQSRIDCVKLAKRKAEIYILRNNKNIVDNLRFKDNIKYQNRVNATIQYIEDDMSVNEKKLWLMNFDTPPEKINIEKYNYFQTIDGISLSSDGFFPFRDSIDQASLLNILYVVQPGGSVADISVVDACNEYNMVMFNSNIRSFHH